MALSGVRPCGRRVVAADRQIWWRRRSGSTLAGQPVLLDPGAKLGACQAEDSRRLDLLLPVRARAWRIISRSAASSVPDGAWVGAGGAAALSGAGEAAMPRGRCSLV